MDKEILGDDPCKRVAQVLDSFRLGTATREIEEPIIGVMQRCIERYYRLARLGDKGVATKSHAALTNYLWRANWGVHETPWSKDELSGLLARTFPLPEHSGK